MNAVCEHCATQITIDEAALGPHDAEVRCPSCGAMTTIARVPFETEPRNYVLDPDALELAEETVVMSSPVSTPHTEAPLELLDDCDLMPLEPEATLTPDLAEESPPLPPSADDWRTATRVAIVPRLKKTEPKREHENDKPAKVAVFDEISGDLKLAGGLTAEGVFIAPEPAVASKPRAQEVPAPLPRPEPFSTLVVQPAAKLEHAGKITAQARASTASLRALERRSPLGVIGAVLGMTASVAVFLFGTYVFLRGGTVGASNKAGGERSPLVALDGVELRSARSVLYPTRSGANVLVVFGQVYNTSASPRRHMQVEVELRDETDRKLAATTAPVGITLTPEELRVADDVAALASIYRLRVLTNLPASVIEPASSASFSAVIRYPPAALDAVRHEIRLSYAKPLFPPTPLPPYLLPRFTEVTLDLEAKPSKMKGKGKRRARHKLRQ